MLAPPQGSAANPGSTPRLLIGGVRGSGGGGGGAGYDCRGLALRLRRLLGSTKTTTISPLFPVFDAGCTVTPRMLDHPSPRNDPLAPCTCTLFPALANDVVTETGQPSEVARPPKIDFLKTLRRQAGYAVRLRNSRWCVREVQMRRHPPRAETVAQRRRLKPNLAD